MKIKYLGTAAAEGMPAVFCRCDFCEKVRKKGGKSIRTRSQILIDDTVLVDFPPDGYLHSLRYGIDLSAVSDILITHSHSDHCYTEDLAMRCAPYAHNLSLGSVNLYGNATVINKFVEHTKAEIKPVAKESIILHTVKPYDDFTLASGIKVSALPAVHTAGEDCLLYALSSRGKTLFVMNDTGKLPECVYEEAARKKLRFDLVSFDCTYGATGHGSGRHMGLSDNVAEREKMIKYGLVDGSTQYIVTHFSHNNGLAYEDMCSAASAVGMIVAYDGMEINV